MVQSLIDLNQDCLLEILKTWLLSEDAKVYTMHVTYTNAIYYNNIAIRTERKQSLNQITLMHPLLHELFESLVEKYAVYVLHVISETGLDKEIPILLEKIELPFEDVRYLRLHVLVKPMEGPSRWAVGVKNFMRDNLSKISKMITKFTNLKDLEFCLTVDPDDFTSPAFSQLRHHMLFNFINSLHPMSKLVRCSIIYNIRTYDLISVAWATHKRAHGGDFELDLNQLRLRCSEQECVEFIYSVNSRDGTNLEVDLDHKGRVLAPRCDKEGNLTGYTVTVETARGNFRLKDVNMISE